LPYPLKIKNNEGILKKIKTQNYKHIFQWEKEDELKE
jgi:hypothetical protein